MNWDYEIHTDSSQAPSSGKNEEIANTFLRLFVPGHLFQAVTASLRWGVVWGVSWTLKAEDGVCFTCPLRDQQGSHRGLVTFACTCNAVMLVHLTDEQYETRQS